MKKGMLKFSLLITLLCLTSLSLASVSSTQMPYRYRNNEDGATISTSWTFPNTFFTTVGTYCDTWLSIPPCEDEESNIYEHSHLPHHFPFTSPSPWSDSVTVTKSDWAWNAYYSGYTKLSNSTFVTNCYSYAVSCSRVIFHSCYINNWTFSSSLSEDTTETRSYANSSDGHAVRIDDIHHVDDCMWVVATTSEKHASGGVYEYDYMLPGGFDPDDPVRKTR